MDNSKSSTEGNDESSSSPKYDILLNFITEMLMEEDDDLVNNPYMIHDMLALQATEKSFHDALHNTNPPATSGVEKDEESESESEALERYDDVLLCSHSDLSKKKPPPHRRKDDDTLVDLGRLLMLCAEAVANLDKNTTNALLSEIRQHSSPRGRDSMQRLAHYFANALEARSACTGTYLYSALTSRRASAAEILNSYKIFVIACPYRHMSNMLANQTILNLSRNATTLTTKLHIIDFGILYGLQWPCLIQVLSERRGGPPKLRITGIDFPQPGPRPAERVADTGRRLAKCAEKFGVPFEFHAVARRWDNITLEDVVEKKKEEEEEELVVVNCMYRLHNVADETETGHNSPRDVVLRLIKGIEPDLFIHGVANGTHSTPFFLPRFKEVMFHFSSMFNMFETTVHEEDEEERTLFEEQIFGKEAMNIIACEGMERVERPETYKQWQARIVRGGFRQVRIDPGIVKSLSQVKMYYHKSFLVDEDGKWVLIGWKGRVVLGFSCWRPTHHRVSS